MFKSYASQHENPCYDWVGCDGKIDFCANSLYYFYFSFYYSLYLFILFIIYRHGGLTGSQGLKGFLDHQQGIWWAGDVLRPP